MGNDRDTYLWIQNLEDHFSELWHRIGLTVDKKNPYVITQDSKSYLFHPRFINHLSGMDINFHSPTNPKSSQILGLNFFLSVENLPLSFFQSLFENPLLASLPRIFFEWVDRENILMQEGNPSHHDVLLDFDQYKYLIEIKYTETSFSGCKTSFRNEDCNGSTVKLDCPLERKFGTKYLSYLRSENTPFDLNKINYEYNSCPFLKGELYQIMRYMSLCYYKTLLKNIWIPVVMYSKQNGIMDREFSHTHVLLKNPSTLLSVA